MRFARGIVLGIGLTALLLIAIPAAVLLAIAVGVWRALEWLLRKMERG